MNSTEAIRLGTQAARNLAQTGQCEIGHLMLSMWQTDIIYYGTDLVDYIHQEFGGPGIDRTDPRWRPRATVPFWRDFL